MKFKDIINELNELNEKATNINFFSGTKVMWMEGKTKYYGIIDKVNLKTCIIKNIKDDTGSKSNWNSKEVSIKKLNPSKI